MRKESFCKKSFLIIVLLGFISSSVFASQVFEATYKEDFESAPEFGLPTGWTEYNETDDVDGSYVAGETTNLGKSSELKGWTVLSIEKLKLIDNDRLSNPAVVSGKCVYAESDKRNGIQRQYLYTPVFDLRKLANVQMQFDSNYEQNQDNIDFAEYTLQGNLPNGDAKKIWLPIFYWMKDTEITDAAEDIQTLMDTNTLDDNGADAYSMYIGADIASISLKDNIQGRGDDDSVTNKKSESFALPKAAGQQYVQVRFFQGGGGSWYWGIDNFAIGSIIESVATAPDKPTLSLSAAKLTLKDDVKIVSSGYVSKNGTAMKSCVWEIASDSAFANILLTKTTVDSTITSIAAPIYFVQFDSAPIYARIKYTDANNLASEYSNTVEITISAGTTMKAVFTEGFESIEEWTTPTGWQCVDFSTAEGQLPTVWNVYTWDTLAAVGDSPAKYTSVRDIVAGDKSCLSNSDMGGGGTQESHLFSPKINLSAYKNVWLTFNSNYVQNQDNIGVLEYSIDGGNISEDGKVTGTFLPIAYMLDVGSIKTDAAGNIDAVATFADSNIAGGARRATDEADRSYGSYVLAMLTTPVAELSPYISPRINDNVTESKRYEKYRLPKADNQANVRIRWMNMGTDSWFWGIDNVQVWGEAGTDINDWSLF